MIIDKDNIKILLFILILGLGIGYAYINSDLNINGTAQVNSANWDVHWANVQVSTGSVSASNPTISNQTTVNYSVTLNNPGDYYEFTVDAVNGGSIDAMIDTIDSKLNGATITTLPDYLDYTVTYNLGDSLEPNHQLLHNTTETYKVRIEYNDDIELNQIPASDQTLSLSFTVTYRQATDDAQEVNHPVPKYTANVYDIDDPEHTEVRIGQAIPNGLIQYNSASEALAALRSATGDNTIQFYLKHRVQEGIVTDSYIEFIVTPDMVSANPDMTAGTYTLRGIDIYDENASSTNYCQEEYYNSSTEECISPYYATTKETLLSAFGSSNCTDYSYAFLCEVSGLEASTGMSGSISVRGHSVAGNWYCNVGYSGYSSCSSANFG